MQIRLHHTHIFASDMEATLEFWQDVFGARVLFDMEIGIGEHIGCFNPTILGFLGSYFQMI